MMHTTELNLYLGNEKTSLVMNVILGLNGLSELQNVLSKEEYDEVVQFIAYRISRAHCTTVGDNWWRLYKRILNELPEGSADEMIMERVLNELRKNKKERVKG